MENSDKNKVIDTIIRHGINPEGVLELPDAYKPYIERILSEFEYQFEQKEKVLKRNFAQKELQLKRESSELHGRFNDLEKEWNHRLAQKDVELQSDRAELHAQFAAREISLRQEIANQQIALNEREAMFRTKSETIAEEAKRVASESRVLEKELRQRVVDHEKAIADLVRQKEQFQADFQARMESKATEYVDSALASLKSSEERFDRIGYAWSLAGLATVLIGLFLGYLLALEGTKDVVSNKDISWALMLFFAAKGAVLLGLVFAVVRLCLKLARSYLHESLKNAERRHAINYGKFYLSVYGAGTDGEKVKDVFAHWNITGNSAFSEKENVLPPQANTIEDGAIAKAIVFGFQKVAEGRSK